MKDHTVEFNGETYTVSAECFKFVSSLRGAMHAALTGDTAGAVLIELGDRDKVRVSHFAAPTRCGELLRRTREAFAVIDMNADIELRSTVSGSAVRN